MASATAATVGIGQHLLVRLPLLVQPPIAPPTMPHRTARVEGRRAGSRAANQPGRLVRDLPGPYQVGRLPQAQDRPADAPPPAGRPRRVAAPRRRRWPTRTARRAGQVGRRTRRTGWSSPLVQSGRSRTDGTGGGRPPAGPARQRPPTPDGGHGGSGNDDNQVSHAHHGGRDSTGPVQSSEPVIVRAGVVTGTLRSPMMPHYRAAILSGPRGPFAVVELTAAEQGKLSADDRRALTGCVRKQHGTIPVVFVVGQPQHAERDSRAGDRGGLGRLPVQPPGRGRPVDALRPPCRRGRCPVRVAGGHARRGVRPPTAAARMRAGYTPACSSVFVGPTLTRGPVVTMVWACSPSPHWWRTPS